MKKVRPRVRAEGRSDHSVTQSLRLTRGISRRCRNPLCRGEFILKRKYHYFCCRKCKTQFYKIKYGLQELALHFIVDPESKQQDKEEDKIEKP